MIINVSSAAAAMDWAVHLSGSTNSCHPLTLITLCGVWFQTTILFPCPPFFLCLFFNTFKEEEEVEEEEDVEETQVELDVVMEELPSS